MNTIPGSDFCGPSNMPVRQNPASNSAMFSYKATISSATEKMQLINFL